MRFLGVLKKITIFLFAIGIVLLSFNIIGLFLPLRSPYIYQLKTEFENDIVLTGKEAKNLISKKEGSNEAFVIKVNNVVSRAVEHYWGEEIDRYHLRVPIYENYLLFFAGFIHPAYKKYEYCNHYKALERGVGLCSQVAIIVTGILNENKINASIVGLGGHTVVRTEINKPHNTWWILDPDYGVIIKHDIEEIEQNPEIIRSYYEKKGYNNETINDLIKIYGKEGNFVYKKGVMEYTDCKWKKYYIERLSYIFIWIIPLFFSLPYLFQFFKKYLIKNQ